MLHSMVTPAKSLLSPVLAVAVPAGTGTGVARAARARLEIRLVGRLRVDLSAYAELPPTNRGSACGRTPQIEAVGAWAGGSRSH
jgi:hypothetical protein